MTDIKLQFESRLNFQIDAINSVIELFEGSNVSEGVYPDFIDGINSNKLNISKEMILDNLQKIQEYNEIKKSEFLKTMNFSIEMETGTGKTYVYTRTIIELAKRYNFKKFIILVPSVAIREGVKKSLEITKNHIQEIYDKISYSFYEYDSKKINTIRHFSRSNNIEILIMTVDSFNKSTNIMNNPTEKLSGKRPIEFIQKTNPILILDEPQNMESEKSKKAIDELNPLFALRYSATHRDVYNLIYRLTPVDAYKKGLVKKIEVSSVTKDDDFNNAYMACTEIKADKSKIRAKLKINKKFKDRHKQTEITVAQSDDLYKKSNQNDEYRDFIITEINASKGIIRFSNGINIRIDQEIGGDRDEIMKLQIKETIENHMIKYEKLKKKGIKALSLFFIDKVDNFLPEDGFIRKYFDQAFNEMKKEYTSFAELEPEEVRRHYFSKMKTESKMEEDKESFNLIMKDKERLLSFDDKTQFIFSHSALREGWDNPNVFNICTLNQSISEIKKRQEIGRGLRLPVSSYNGNRVYGEDNILTVIANEHYAKYVESLQNEYIEEYGTGQVPTISNAKRKTKLRLKHEVIEDKNFKKLWDKISQETKYIVNIDTEKFIKKCTEIINEGISVNNVGLRVQTVQISLEEDQGIQTVWSKIGSAIKPIEKTYPITDIVDKISKETNLTRKTVVKIIQGLENLDLIFKNPEQYLMSIVYVIKQTISEFMVDGIKYESTNKEYNKSRFKDIIETYSDSIVSVDNSIYDAIVYDSEIEKNFANDAGKNQNIKLLIKLPDWFTINTPIGTYNPDWAIVKDETDQYGKIKETLYLVRETKGVSSDRIRELRESEQRKIFCAKKHFTKIGVNYKIVKNVEEI